MIFVVVVLVVDAVCFLFLFYQIISFQWHFLGYYKK